MHFQSVILPEYHSMVDADTAAPDLPGWHLSLSSMSPLQRYSFLEKAKTVTPDWSTVSILKLHHSSGHKVGKWGIRFSNTYYQADELAQAVGDSVDILYHRVQPPHAPSSLTVIHQNRYLCEAYPAERRHLTGDRSIDIVHDSDRQNRPAQEIKSTIARIRQSADAILPNKAKSTPGEQNQLFDMIFAPAIAEESESLQYADDTSSPSGRSTVRKGLSFLFGEE